MAKCINLQLQSLQQTYRHIYGIVLAWTNILWKSIKSKRFFFTHHITNLGTSHIILYEGQLDRKRIEIDE